MDDTPNDDPTPDLGFIPPRVVDSDPTSNLEWNRQRWGQAEGWRSHDQFGYRWGGGFQQTVGSLARFADERFRPFTNGRYDLNILEIAPGGGRFTAELARYAASLCLIDLNEAALDVCRQRFSYLPTPIDYVVGNGTSFDGVPDGPVWEAVVCYDSMVHMHPDVIAGYIQALPTVLAVGGFAWLDHSGKGARPQGHRTAMTDALMREFAAEAGLEVVSQRFRNSWDCVSVLRRPA